MFAISYISNMAFFVATGRLEKMKAFVEIYFGANSRVLSFVKSSGVDCSKHKTFLIRFTLG